MRMRLSLIDWSILQVLIIVTCHRWKVYGEMSEGCVGRQQLLSLSCPEMKIIQIKDVILGDSGCYFTSCCIKPNDCTRNASEDHKTDVQRQCDDKQSCSVKTRKEQIPCGYWNTWSNNDFERIKYDCMNETRNGTTINSTHEESTEDDIDLIPETALGCVESRLNLSCPEVTVIQIVDVVIGASLYTGTTCNITDSNCTRPASENHKMDVHRRCNGQSNCVVVVLQEEVHCEVLDLLPHKGFESITYYCLNKSQDNLTSTTYGTVTVTHNISNKTEAEAATYESNSHMLTIAIVIPCIIVLLVIILIAVVMYRRKQGARMKTPLDPVAMTEVDNGQNVYDVCADETQGTSLHGDGYAQPMYSQIEESDSPKRGENPIIYSEVELRGAIWKDGETTSETKAAAVKSSTQPQTGTVSKPSSPQDDGCQIVIENDLYGMADNCVKDTAVESPTRSLAGAVSKTPSPQDDEGLTLIENDIYCH